MISSFPLRMRTILVISMLLGCSCVLAAADLQSSKSSLDRGFQLLYDLEFAQAHQLFQSWQRDHPDDPLASASDAAGLLFSEFNRLGILESQFYTDDRTFAARRRLAPDPSVRDQFNAAIDHAESLARSRISKNQTDRDALFAMVLASGLKADYAALIEKRNLASLRFTKEATGWAQKLLAQDPGYYDAHLATGISQYITGSMSAPIRWVLHLDGISADKQAGVRDLQLTAERGHYLAPFARILLAIAYVRDKDVKRAREVLVALRDEFPHNPLFANEISRLDSATPSAK